MTDAGVSETFEGCFAKLTFDGSFYSDTWLPPTEVISRRKETLHFHTLLLTGVGSAWCRTLANLR